MIKSLVVSDPTIMLGKPVIAGTRLSVEWVLEELSGGRTIEDLIAAHPRLTREGILAALAFAAAYMRGEETHPIEPP